MQGFVAAILAGIAVTIHFTWFDGFAAAMVVFALLPWHPSHYGRPIHELDPLYRKRS